MFKNLLKWLKVYENPPVEVLVQPKKRFKKVKVTRAQYDRILTLRSEKFTLYEIAAKTGVSASTCGNVLRYKDYYDKAINRTERVI